MRLKLFTSLLFVCMTVFAVHAENKDFETYAQQQYQNMTKAYQERNTKAFGALMTELISHYNQLSTADRKYYNYFIINGYYDYCCTYSVLNQKKEALTYLAKSIKEGYINYAHIQEDTDLDNIRHEKAFTEMIAPLRKVGDYMYILQHAGAYNTNDHREVPAFTYQSADNPHLIALRTTLKLDSIAGKGNEVSKVLNLMYWIHDLVPHDGNHNNPDVKNALSMINVCKQEKRGLNCRGLATVLNECYLALGIKSRFVTCLPKDSLGVDNDCHVINMVYINSLKKWIWIDPTFAAYVRNEKGDFLGLEEVRERLVNNKPLILNPEANWNHKASETKDYYLYTYMAKNLYRLQCPASSEYDTETAMPGKNINYIDLFPLEYYKQSAANKSTSTNNNTKVTFTTYATNNPSLFWATPGQ